MKRIIAAFILIFISFAAQAQRPNLPGQLIVDFGFNSWGSRPDGLDLNFFPSNTFNFSYYYDIPLGDGGWTITPGIGLSLEKYDFKDNKTIVSNINSTAGTRTVDVVDLNEEFGANLSFKSSKLGMNYVDIPIEFRWFARRNQYSKGFRFAVGGKVGYNYSSFTRINFKDALGDNRMLKDRQNLNFNKFRYGVIGRVGWSGFGVFGFYELSDKWENPPVGGANTRTLTIGISLTAF